MRIEFPHVQLPLRAEQVVRLNADAGTRLQVASGAVWVTVEAELDDHVLSAGQTWTAPSRARLVVSSLGGPAVLALCDPRPQATSQPAPARAMSNRHAWLLPRLLLPASLQSTV